MRSKIAAAVARIEHDAALDERARLAEVRALGAVPVEVGPEVPEAPARGPVVAFDTMAFYPTEQNKWKAKPAGFMGRKTLRSADSFDVMAAKAARHRKPAPFNASQVAMGRLYRDLVEKHECAGVRCSSLEASTRSGGGSGSDWIDAVLRDRERIAILRRRIGDGSAVVVRRVRPSQRGSRVTIMDRRLVDIVCLEDGTISDVLRVHGWSDDAKLRSKLREALAGILDRMMGPPPSGGEFFFRPDDG